MRNFLIAGILMLFAAGAACAQTAPKTEFFVGYEYQRLNPGGNGCHGLGLNLTYNLNDWLGGVGDFGLCRQSGLPSGLSAHNINYLFGPRLTYRNFGKWNPFGQVLLGGHHVGTNVGSANSFAMTLGGGMDYQYNDRFSLRLIQVEYLYTHLGGATQNNARIEAGLVYTW